MLKELSRAKNSNQHLARRRVFFAAAMIPFLPDSKCFAAGSTPTLKISVHNLHTDERLTTTFWEDGEYNSMSLQELNWLLRDHRSGDVGFIDSDLYSLMALTYMTSKASAPISIISGFRSRKTNRMLLRSSSGVAKSSYHVKAKAVDIRIQGVDTQILRDIAIELKCGGVGYYPSSNFVHLDTGPRRIWQGR